MKKFYINFTESRRMKIDVWKEEIKLDFGKKKVDTNKTQLSINITHETAIMVNSWSTVTRSTTE